MATRMQQRRGTATQWTNANPILAAGEIGFETNTGKFKIGDGANRWADLSYFTDSQDFDTSNFVLNSQKAAANGVATLNSSGKVPEVQMPGAYILGLINERVGEVIGAAPGALDTLNEIAAAIGNDADFVTTITDAIDLKAPLASPTFTGTVSAPTPTSDDNSTKVATTAWVKGLNYATSAELDTLDSVVSTTGTSLNDAIQDITTLQNQVTTINISVSNIDNNVSTNTGAISTINTTLASIATNIASLEDEDDALDVRVSANETSITGINGTLSSHASDISAAQGNITTLQSGLSTLDTEVSGIDTRLIAAESDIDTLQTSATSAVGHASATTNVHGIANTADLATKSYADNAKADANNYTDTVAALKANLASPALTGTPTAPTAALGTDTTQIATTAFVQDAIEAVVGAAPAALNTLSELADAINDDASYAATITSALALKAPLESPSFTGTVALPAASSVTLNGTALSTTLDTKSDKNASINVMSGSHTIVSADVYNVREMSNGGTISIPSDNSFWPIGATVDVIQTGSSQVTISGSSGVTVNATPGLRLRAQWSGATILKRAANTFVVLGDLAS